MIGGNDLAIGVSLIMRDGFTAQALRANAAMGALQNNANQLARSQATLARNSNAAGAAIGVGLLTGMGKAYQQFADFNYIMRFTSLAADSTTQSLDALSNKALEVGKRTIFSSKEVAEGMRWLAQAGMDSKSIISTIDAASDLAAATLSPLSGEKGAADMLAKITTAFKIPRSLENMKRVGDILAIGANESLTDLVKFGEGMTYAQTTAMRLKMTLEETTAAVMVLSNAGIQGTVTGTTLDNMQRYLADAASGRRPKQVKALDKLGLSPSDLKDARNNLLPLGTILAKMSDGLKGLGTVDKNQIAIDIFGVRGAKGTELIDSLSKYNEFLRMTQQNMGYSADMAKKMMDSDKGAIDIMKSTWESLKIQFGGTIAPIITPILKIASKVMDIISSVASTPVGKLLTMFGSIFVFVRTAQMGYRAILLSIQLLQTQLGNSITTTGSTTVSNFGRMTTAANTYTSALTRMNMALALPGGKFGTGRVGQFSHGGYYQVGPGGGYMPLSKGSYKVGLSKLNNFFNKASLPAMLAGMGLGMASEGLGGNETGMGRGLGIAGDAIGYAGTGAMIGSIIPGIGTTIGAIVGGVGGLLFSLHERLQDLNNDIGTKMSTSRSQDRNLEKIKKEMDIYRKLNWKDRAWLDMDTNISGEVIRAGKSNKPFQKENREISNTIILQVNGEDRWKKTLEGDYNKEAIDLGIY